MKAIKLINLFILALLFTAILLVSAGVFSACKEKCENPHRDNIIGQWKLLEISISVNHSQPDTTDYSEENIIFDFQENNKLVVTGNIVDSLSLFDDFQEGGHFYEYRKHECGHNYLPGPNLRISNNEQEHGSWGGRRYFCSAHLSEETIGISSDGYKIIDDDNYSWGIKLIKLK